MGISQIAFDSLLVTAPWYSSKTQRPVYTGDVFSLAWMCAATSLLVGGGLGSCSGSAFFLAHECVV